MYSEKMFLLGSKRSVIRELFEYGKTQAKKVGQENVFDFSIGNPSVPPPKAIQENLVNLLTQEEPMSVHGYTSAQGDPLVRKSIADNLNLRYSTDFSADDLYMTVGAAAALSICLKAVITDNANDVLTVAPYFTEYKVFVECNGGNLKVVPPRCSDFQIDFDEFEKLLSPNTCAVIINSPNNPSGVVYTEETLKTLSELLVKKEKEFNHEIYLISDEPYREIVYNGKVAPFVTKYYDNTFVCYSYSKSLSLPGERIGYVLVSNKMKNNRSIYSAICGAGRALGYICAPSIFQKLIINCSGLTSDLSYYANNRDLLYKSLTDIGYECVYPDGAFYLFMKTLEPNSMNFCEKAKKYNLLLVPADDFGCPGYVRIAYCVSNSMIERSKCAFEKLYEEYQQN